MNAPQLDHLDVVMPVFNEGEAVGAAVSSLRTAARRAELQLRVIIIDDGSSPDHATFLDELALFDDVTLLRQENSGRFRARQKGIDEASNEFILLADARVRVRSDALVLIKRQVVDHGKKVWNFDVHLANDTSIWATFWFGLTAVWWCDYFQHRREVVITEENYDRFPKGTGAFFAPRDVLVDALGQFSSHFDNDALSSDDTGLLRAIARSEGIHLSPEIACDFYGKDGPRNWVRQCYYRGTTFVDGYLTDPGKAPAMLAAGLGATALVGITAVRAPKVLAAGAVLGGIAAGALAKWCGAKTSEACSVGVLSTPFGAVFGAGVLRGLALAARADKRSS